MTATPRAWFRREAGVMWFIGVAALLLGGRPAGAHAPGARLVGITLSPAGGTLRAHNSLAMKALGSFDDGTSGVDLTLSVGWSSTDPSVAIVQAGYVTGTGSGTVTISATDPATGVSSDPTSGGVTVVARLFAIRLQPARRVLPMRESTSYHAFGTFEGGVSLEITSDVDWGIGDPGIASLSPAGRARGLALGSTRVHAVDRRSGISSATTSQTGALTIVGTLTSLQVTPPRLAVAPGGNANLKARATFTGSPLVFSYTSRVRWASTQPDVVSVDREGLVTCAGEGSAVISTSDRLTGTTSTATGGDSTVVCGGDVVAIRVSPRRFIMPLGTSRQMRAIYTFADGTAAEGTRQVTWSATDPGVIGIVADGATGGTVTALAAGQSAIIALDVPRSLGSDRPGGVNGVLVVPHALTALTIVPMPAPGEGLAGLSGSILKLKARAVFDNGFTRNVNGLAAWSSSVPGTVMVSDGSDFEVAGTAHLLQPGRAVVSATYPKVGGPGSLTASVEVSVFDLGSTSGAFVAPLTGW